MEMHLKNLSALTHDELTFIFSMMRKYGGMPDVNAIEQSTQPQKRRGKQNNRRNNTPKKDVKPIDKTKPNLFDFTDPKWVKCEDKMFLAYKELMEKDRVDRYYHKA